MLIKRLFLLTYLFLSTAWAGSLEEGIEAFKAKNYDKALPSIQVAAEQGVTSAQGLLARMLYNGWGINNDTETALKWARLAASKGDASGQNVLGASFLKNKQYAEALKWFQLAADQSYAPSQSNLGEMYYFGWGVEKNTDEALKWTNLAVNQNYPRAQFNLGFAYEKGLGLPKDLKEALKWYRIAADQNSADAQAAVGWFYANGNVVSKDWREAEKWFSLSALQGNTHGQASLGYIYLGASKNDPQAKYPEALKLFLKAAEKGNSMAQANLGHMHDYGLGVKEDLEEAAKWYLLSAAQGNEYSKNRLKRNASIASAAERVQEKNTKPNLLATNSQLKDEEEEKAKEAQRIALLDENPKKQDQPEANANAKVKEQNRLAQEAKAKEAERLAQEARAKELARLEQEAKVKEQVRLAQEAKTKEAERLAQEARSKEQARLEQEAKVKEQVRIAQEAKAKEAERLAQETSAKEQLRISKNEVSPTPIFANRRALVIGNDNYKSVTKLINAREDAKAIAASLQQVGYQVTLKTDLNEREMKAVLRTFKSQVEGGDEVLFFYAGHGVQIGAANYLLPIDISGENAEQVKDEAIQLQRVLDDLTERKAKFSLAIIDACRDNPFKTAGRDLGGRGLSPTSAATGQMVIFSAGTGQQALDNLGPKDKNKNGLFTRVFLQEMQKPGISIDRVVRSVRTEVVGLAKSVGHEQVPAIYDQVVGDFYFRK